MSMSTTKMYMYITHTPLLFPDNVFKNDIKVNILQLWATYISKAMHTIAY